MWSDCLRCLLLHLIHHYFLCYLTCTASLTLISSNYSIISLHHILVYSFLQNYFKNMLFTEKTQFILGDRGEPRLSAGPTAVGKQCNSKAQHFLCQGKRPESLSYRLGPQKKAFTYRELTFHRVTQ